jgi:hypothetical protein
MSRHDPRPVMVIADGRCKFIGEAKWNEVKDAQESLPEEMRMLLCLIDGAERRQNLLRRWSGQAPVTAPLAAHTAAVSSKSPTQITYLCYRIGKSLTIHRLWQHWSSWHPLVNSLHGIVIIVRRDEDDGCFAYFSEPPCGLYAVA